MSLLCHGRQVYDVVGRNLIAKVTRQCAKHTIAKQNKQACQRIYMLLRKHGIWVKKRLQPLYTEAPHASHMCSSCPLRTDVALIPLICDVKRRCDVNDAISNATRTHRSWQYAKTTENIRKTRRRAENHRSINPHHGAKVQIASLG